MTYARYSVDVPAEKRVSTELNDNEVGTSFQGSIDGSVPLFVEVDSIEELAEHLFRLATDRRDFIRDLVDERNEEDENLYVHGEEAEVQLLNVSPAVMYLAARRAAEEELAKSPVEVLIEWASKSGPLADIKDAPYNARKAVVALVDDEPESTTTIDAEAQLEGTPFEG